MDDSVSMKNTSPTRRETDQDIQHGDRQLGTVAEDQPLPTTTVDGGNLLEAKAFDIPVSIESGQGRFELRLNTGALLATAKHRETLVAFAKVNGLTLQVRPSVVSADGGETPSTTRATCDDCGTEGWRGDWPRPGWNSPRRSGHAVRPLRRRPHAARLWPASKDGVRIGREAVRGILMTADRALVVFYDKADLSPVTYVHRTGKDVPTYLRIWRDHPDLAGLTLPQTSALFVGICYDHLSATDMAIWTPAKDAVSPHRLTDRAHAILDQRQSR